VKTNFEDDQKLFFFLISSTKIPEIYSVCKLGNSSVTHDTVHPFMLQPSKPYGVRVSIS